MKLKLSHFFRFSSPYPSNLLDSGTVELLIRHFGGKHGQQTNLINAELGFGLIHYSFIRLFKPERVLCLGSELGFVPALCALACRDNHKGQVDFVDAGKDETDRLSWGGTGFWKKHNPKQHFSLLGLESYINPHIMTTKQFAKKFPYQYEYIYVDADHSYEGVKTDFSLFWPRLTHLGLMIFHDIFQTGLANGSEYGVWQVWDELTKIHPHFVVPGADNALGILQKIK